MREYDYDSFVDACMLLIALTIGVAIVSIVLIDFDVVDTLICFSIVLVSLMVSFAVLAALCFFLNITLEYKTTVVLMIPLTIIWWFIIEWILM